jgi:hypothetical protein
MLNLESGPRPRSQRLDGFAPCLFDVVELKPDEVVR